VFFVFAMLLGAALQITNAFGGAFLDDFKSTHPGTFGVEHPNLLLSISQIMTNGLGAFLGGITSGWVVDHFTVNGLKDWRSIWVTFAGYTLTLSIVFPLVFRYRHDTEKTAQVG
jgi:MFS family permease